MNNMFQRNYEAVFAEVNSKIDLDIVMHRLPSHVPKTHLNALLLTVRAALLKATMLDQLTSSAPDFDSLRAHIEDNRASEKELKEYDLRTDGFFEAYNAFLDENIQVEEYLASGEFVYYNEAGFPLNTLDEGDE